MLLMNGLVEVGKVATQHIYENFELYQWGVEQGDSKKESQYRLKLIEDANMIAAINGFESDSEQATDIYTDIMKIMREKYKEKNN